MPVAVMEVTVASLVLLLASGTYAFLATPLNVTDPDVIDIFCPELTTGVTRDHKWITREAIRRNIRQFFLDYSPPSRPDFNVPTDASLTELYHAYYGDAASPVRFIKAVNAIAASNVKSDSTTQLRHDPGIQNDGEQFDAVAENLRKRYPQILNSILQDEAYSAARSLLGLSLHSIQKFYSHSTWVERGNEEILANLGLPDFVFENTAGTEEEVCTPCANPQGSCSDNVLVGAGLTTGYYEYVDAAADGFLVPKPSGGGKCSHGGVLDDSANMFPVGGINKDTASPCFSPHYYLHDKAVELAVKATDHYLNVVLDVVGNERYRRLFELYQGSALSIAIDTTQSMGNDIAAVQSQVAQIINASSPEFYILAPFSDPTVGPLTKTDDAEVFLEAVNSLTAEYGGDAPELFWHGLQLALSHTPDYGNVFCFTDAGGKDGSVLEGVTALAVDRAIKVNIVYSGKITEAEGRLITGIPEYQALADATGGLFIPSNKFEIDAITPILGDSVESSDVDITMLKELEGKHVVNIPIDDSILDFKIQVAGYIQKAILLDITGTKYNLTDQIALESDPDVEVIALAEALISLRFLKPRYGMWQLDLEANSTYSLAVTANSTLAWLGDFAILDPSPPHPHYRPALGRPLTNWIYYLDVTLVGYLESKVIDVYLVEYVDVSGSLLRTIPYSGEIDDVFYIRSDPLPEQPFYIKLYGHVQSGNVFSRLQYVLIQPSDASVEVLATSTQLAAKPGHSAHGDFLVTNYGLESDFNITGTDSEKYLKSMDPVTIHLTQGGSGIVTANFRVKSSAVPGTISTVMVTAQSLKQTYSVNTAITHFYVRPQAEETTPPTCVLAAEPDCSGFNFNGICHQKNWTVEATLQDVDSGLSSVYARPDGLVSTVMGLDPGVTAVVNMTYSADCCSPQVDIIGVDMQGNIGKCVIDMGDLGGYILNLEAEAVGQRWVLLRWEITTSALSLHKYGLLVNNDYTQEFPCMDAVCRYNVTYLEPCSIQTFQLTPFFYEGAEDRAGLPAFADATTLDVEPGIPFNGVQVNGTLTTITVAWEAENTKCACLFEVCYRPFGFSALQPCERTSLTTYVMQGIEPCAVYEVTLTAISPSGYQSDPHVFYVNSVDAEPEAPRNLLADFIQQNSVTLTWDDPLHRIQCIDRYLVVFGEEERSVHKNGLNHRGQHYATLSPLLPCTNYTFDVYAISKTEKVGPGARKDAATLEDEDPKPVTNLLVTSIGTASLNATWESTGNCIDHYRVCYYEPSVPQEECQEVFQEEAALNVLNPCTSYKVLVNTVSPSGIVSNRTTQSSRTLDVQPGEPQNLRVLEETAHTLQISYDPPKTDPQCANQYDIEQIRLDVYERVLQPESHFENIFYDLEACTNYEVRIRAVSKSLQPSAWVSTFASTTEDTPSEPRNFELDNASPEAITLVWYQPEVNGMCTHWYVLEWSATDGSTGSTTVGSSDPGVPMPFRVEASIPGLNMCTTYQFNVTAVTSTGTQGGTAVLTASTAGCISS